MQWVPLTTSNLIHESVLAISGIHCNIDINQKHFLLEKDLLLVGGCS